MTFDVLTLASRDASSSTGSSSTGRAAAVTADATTSHSRASSLDLLRGVATGLCLLFLSLGFTSGVLGLAT